MNLLNKITLEKFTFWLAENLLPLVIRLFGLTWHIKIIGHDPIKTETQFMYAFWHGRMLPLIFSHKFQGINVLISEHRDGEYVARAIKRFGFATIRGSSSKGGLKALRKIVQSLSKGERCFAIASDGPTGPRFKVKKGTAFIAKAANVPVYPVGVRVDQAIHLSSWDDFIIPLPFANINIIMGTSLRPDNETLATLQKKIQQNLVQLDETKITSSSLDTEKSTALL